MSFNVDVSVNLSASSNTKLLILFKHYKLKQLDSIFSLINLINLPGVDIKISGHFVVNLSDFLSNVPPNILEINNDGF